MEIYEVNGMSEGHWLVAQVDINQDLAGTMHTNINYMEHVGDNQFKWPKNFHLLLTLKEDLLTKCDPPPNWWAAQFKPTMLASRKAMPLQLRLSSW